VTLPCTAPAAATALDAVVLYWKWTVYPFVSEFRRQISSVEEQQKQQQQQQQQQQRRQLAVVESPLVSALRLGLCSFCDEVTLPQRIHSTPYTSHSH
jgi:hypothetical protein